MIAVWIVFSIVIVLCVAGFVIHALFASEKVEMDDELRREAPGKFIRLTGGVTHYRLEGPESAPVVVLVPGATLPMFVWKNLDSRLAAEGYRVLTYDLFGRGYSDRPWRRYDADFHDGQLVELLDRLGIKKASFIGLAFGVPLMATFVAKRPARVEKLVAMAPDGFGVVMSPNSTRWYMRIPLLRDYVFSLVGAKILLARLPAYSRNSAVVAELSERYAPTLAWRGFKHAVLSSIKNIPIHDASSLYAKVASSNIPLAILWGTDDRVTPFPGELPLRKVFPTAVLDVMDGVGHLPHYEDPERVFAFIGSFLKGCSRSDEERSRSVG